MLLVKLTVAVHVDASDVDGALLSDLADDIGDELKDFKENFSDNATNIASRYGVDLTIETGD